jgi:hypothetical protein
MGATEKKHTLEQRGFVILRKLVDARALRELRDFVDEDRGTCRTKPLLKAAQTAGVFSRVARVLDTSEDDVRVGKMRVSGESCNRSCATNRTDASGLHKDVMHLCDNVRGIYTAILYLDEASLRVSPSSHKKAAPSPAGALAALLSVLDIDFKAGDGILFNANLLHGIGGHAESDSKRRVIQFFDITKGTSDAILHVRAPYYAPLLAPVIARLSRSAAFKSLSVVTDLRAATGYSARRLRRIIRADVISGESFRARTNLSDVPSEMNTYVHLQKGIDELPRLTNDAIATFIYFL